MPPMEPWEKVFLNVGSGTPEALDDHLAMVSCTGCHGGDASVLEDKDAAHAGLVADPSAGANSPCAACHAEVASSYESSVHFNLWGEKAAIAARIGVAGFDSCPEWVKHGFKGECRSCHATCGDCHVSIPDSAGKGLIKNHQFKKKPHQKNQCMACHGSRIAAEFMGEIEGNEPDIHFSKGMTCMTCHTGAEMHAPSAPGTDRYHVKQAAQCESCHPVKDANPYHLAHWTDLSCYVCHAQSYNNCSRCHVAGGWKNDPNYTQNNPARDFKIGLNPFPDKPYKFVTLRHVPVVPDTFDNWEGSEHGALAGYSSLPTWKYATSHSIRRWTDRTKVPEGAACGAKCHLGPPGGSPDNAGIYLFQDYIQQNWPEEGAANSSVTVDNALPEGWTK